MFWNVFIWNFLHLTHFRRFFTSCDPNPVRSPIMRIRIPSLLTTRCCCRCQGEVTQGSLSLQFTNENPKTLFYHRKALLYKVSCCCCCWCCFCCCFCCCCCCCCRSSSPTRIPRHSSTIGKHCFTRLLLLLLRLLPPLLLLLLLLLCFCCCSWFCCCFCCWCCCCCCF